MMMMNCATFSTSRIIWMIDSILGLFGLGCAISKGARAQEQPFRPSGHARTITTLRRIISQGISMLVILSPAKKLDWSRRPDATTRPAFRPTPWRWRTRRAPWRAGAEKADAYQRQAGRPEHGTVRGVRSPTPRQKPRAPPSTPLRATPTRGWTRARSTPMRWIGRRASAHPVGALRPAAPVRRDAALPAGNGQPPGDRSGQIALRLLGRPDFAAR